ncbi:MAG TPA: hypothetical protein DDW31_07705 [candidate division Zixibacteria bacterium]|jgi:outer membrane protein TolC|nr:hypothetical protein [candidate division Zixibacteria bacterium]
MIRTSFAILVACSASLAWGQEPGPARVLTLAQCLEMAFDQSPELVKAQSSRTLGSVGLQTSASALLPKLSASSSYTQSGPATSVAYDGFGNPVITEGGHSDNYRTSLSASQSLVNLSHWASFKGSINDYQAASATFQQSAASLSFRVKDAYYGLLKLQNALEVSQSSVEQSMEQVSKARVMHQLGSISKSDLLKFEVSLAQNRVALLNAKRGLAAGREALRGLINVEGDFEIDAQVPRPDTTGAILPRDSLLALAKERNPGFRAARRRHQAARDYLWSAWFSKLPSLNASYNYGYSDSAQFRDSRSWKERDSWSFSLSLNWNIFDGTATEAQIRRARAQADAAEADWTLAQRSLDSQVEQIRIEWQAALEELSLIGDLLLQADEDFRLTTEKHRLGAASTLDLLTSQVNYNQSQQEAVKALCDYYLTLARIDQLLGKY